MMVSNSAHFVLFPLMAQGHMNPTFDLAKLLAQRGAIISIITTPHNASRFHHQLSRLTNHSNNLQIHLLFLNFHVLEAFGFPPQCENLDQLPSLRLAYPFLVSLANLQPQVEELLQKLTPSPTCLIADLHLPWTAEIAHSFNIPWIGLHTGSSFCQVICEKTKEKPSDDFFKRVEETKRKAYGIVVNSFEELEPAFVGEFKEQIGREIWCVGPVSLCNEDYDDKAERGRSISDHECLKWLDLQKQESVIYVCLGSLSNVSAMQMIQLGLGLEASKIPFLWLLRDGNELEELNKWISEVGFEVRIEKRGFLVKGWAPQLLILSHPSIGGFLTHCGWNSVLEGICAGVPMVTLPLFADQFCNEKLVVEELEIAVSVKLGKEESDEVREDMVMEAIRELMDDEDGERRKRIRELGKMAKEAVGDGGSSQRNITQLIQAIENRD